MNKDDLFDLVLPEDGVLCLVGIMSDKSAPVATRFFQNRGEDYDSYIRELDLAGYEVYYTTASLKDSSSREALNVLSKKAFYIDLDTKNNGYNTKKEALADLLRFIETIGLPTPTIVDSGWGIHAYWALTESVDYNTWKPVANHFKKRTTELDLRTDRAVTADGARLLRVPETYNKSKKHIKSKLASVRQIGTPISIKDFSDIIGYIQRQENSFFSETFADPVMEKLLKRSNTFKFSRIYKKSVEMITVTEKVEEEYELPDGAKAIRLVNKRVERSAGCPQIAHCVANSAELPYNMWRAALSLAKCCIDKEDAIHAVSRGYHGTDRAAWEAKAEDTNGGYSCETWKGLDMPQLCGQCIHRGKIKNPLALGAVIEEATPEDNIIVTKVEGAGDNVTVEIPITYPSPWMRPKSGGVAVKGNPDSKPAKDADSDPDEILVYERDIWVRRIMTDTDKGYAEVALLLPHDGLVQFRAPYADLLKADKCQEILNNKGCALVGKRLDLMRRYIAAWITYLQDEGSTERARTQFGWCDNRSRFVIGNREIDTDGIVHFSPVISTIENIANIYRKQGSLEEWQEAANVYGRKGNEARALSLFAGLGAPLYSLIGASDGSPIIHLTNAASGVGKSTAQKMVNSVWGHPSEALLSDNDTVNAKLHRAGVVNNLPLCYDEITNMVGDVASKLIFDLSSGKGKNRMKSSSNEERMNNSTWSTIFQTSGNNSLYDLLRTYKASAEGEMMRVLEVPIMEDNNLSKRVADDLFGNKLPNNFGHAGEELMKYVVPNENAVQARATQMREDFDDELGNIGKDRFFSNMFAASFTAAEIANRQGIIDIPIEPVWEWSKRLLGVTKRAIRSSSLTKKESYNYLVNQYWNDNISKILVTNGAVEDVDDTLLNQSALRPINGSMIGRYDKGTERLYLSANEFRLWMAGKRMPSLQILETLQRHKCLVEETEYNLGEGTAIYSTAAVPVFVFDATRLKAPVDK